MFRHDVKVICVLRRSVAYDAEYVHKLKEQCAVYAKHVPFICITNTNVKCEFLPLRHYWPGWWSKMEVFHPSIQGDLLFIDLDTIIVDDISDFLTIRDDIVMLRDFYKPASYGSGLMYLPQHARREVWDKFVNDPEFIMKKHRIGGDQAFLHEIWGNRPICWQDVLPNRVVSYKVDNVRRHGVPVDAAIVCHHGKPKPRDIRWNYGGLKYNQGKWERLEATNAVR